MGSSPSRPEKGRRTSSSSYHRPSSDVPEINKKIDEKEAIFIALQSDIENCIIENNEEAMKSLAAEISAHIMDLQQLKHVKLTSTNLGRTQKLIYNYELALAKLKSIFQFRTGAKKNRESSSSSSSSIFYTKPIDAVEPDIVSDLIQIDNSNNTHRSSIRENQSVLPNISETEDYYARPQVIRNNSLYVKEPQNLEETFATIESEFDVLKDQAQRPVNDVDEYYQLDKGVFYLYVTLKNLEPSQNSTLYERKFKLMQEMTEFRTALDKRSGEYEEQKLFNQEINTLELLLDSATENEIADLRQRALVLYERVEKTTWHLFLLKNKMKLLRRIASYMEKIASSCLSSSLKDSVEHLYGNLDALQDEMNQLKIKTGVESTYSDAVKQNNYLPEFNKLLSNRSDLFSQDEENSEAIYGNIEVLRQHSVPEIPKVLKRTGSNVSQRGTVYVNADIVKQSIPYEPHQLPSRSEIKQQVLSKRPLPLPRNYDDKIINDLPKYWQRLNEIFDQEIFSDTDKLEITEIHKHAEVAKNLFERKIKKITEKFEESVNL